MQDVPLLEPQPCVLTGDVWVLLGLVVEQRPEADPGLPDRTGGQTSPGGARTGGGGTEAEAGLGGDQLERDGVFRGLLEYDKKETYIVSLKL